MSRLYQDCHRTIQDARKSRPLADRLDEMIVHEALTEDDAALIESLDYFFLSTVDTTGQPTVSYKGGAAGFAKVVANRLIFPFYDGNGMQLSAGNVLGTGKVGLLFIDFETPRRLRVQGTATLMESDETSPPGAIMMVSVEPDAIFVNCPRYIHRFERVETSKNVPDAAGNAPLAEWKRLDGLQDVISPDEREQVERVGTIDIAQATEDMAAGKA